VIALEYVITILYRTLVDESRSSAKGLLAKVLLTNAQAMYHYGIGGAGNHTSSFPVEVGMEEKKRSNADRFKEKIVWRKVWERIPGS
jgi:hypothetical protein